MPELPDILLYQEALSRRLRRRKLESIVIRSPSLLRTFEPPIDSVVGRCLLDCSRLGKRLAWRFEGDLFVVFHLMIAGRFHWHDKSVTPRAKNDQAAFQFQLDGRTATLMLTEASSKKRAGVWCFANAENVHALDRGGLDVLETDVLRLMQELRRHNNTLKRALTDPSRFDGIGNAYSDEILHAARLSPLQRTQSLSDEEARRLCV